MNYEVYHDESKVDGYWHGILLVPASKKQTLVGYLDMVRRNVRYPHPIGIKKVKKPGIVSACAESWIQIGVLALMSVRKGAPPCVFLGKRVRGKKKYGRFTEKIGCKLIIFHEVDDHARMSDRLDYGGKVETTFRIGLKGGLHFLGNEEEPIHIEKMHFDGHKHYHRHLDRDRIVGRLRGLRRYCRVANHPDLIDDRSSDHTRVDCHPYADCQLLQLTDLLVGCFRTVLIGPTRPIHREIARPVKAIVDRYVKGYARMRNSRWRDSFCMSQSHLESGQWQFETLECRPDSGEVQLELPLE